MSRLITPYFAWIDVETTGLDPQADALLEVALVVTDTDFRVVSDPESWVVDVGAAGPYCLEMPPLVFDMHQASGLLDVPYGQTTPVAEIDAHLAACLKGWRKRGRQKPWLAGNSITLDRGFLQRFLPRTFANLHYRSLDMTSVVGFAEAIGAAIPAREARGHRALADVLHAIGEARMMRDLLTGGAS